MSQLKEPATSALALFDPKRAYSATLRAQSAHSVSCSNSAFASFKSSVSKPSVNQP
jgi:hypothetical protein